MSVLQIRLYNGYILSVCRQRPSHVESTGSRPITDVKQHRARASSVTTERFLQPRRLDPSILGASHHRRIQLQRHCGVSSGTRLGSKTQILPGSATHSEQTNNTATHRAVDRRSGSSTCKQYVSTANASRPIGDSPSQ